MVKMQQEWHIVRIHQEGHIVRIHQERYVVRNQLDRSTGDTTGMAYEGIYDKNCW